jgi:hypothetical protein
MRVLLRKSMKEIEIPVAVVVCGGNVEDRAMWFAGKQIEV